MTTVLQVRAIGTAKSWLHLPRWTGITTKSVPKDLWKYEIQTFFMRSIYVRYARKDPHQTHYKKGVINFFFTSKYANILH